MNIFSMLLPILLFVVIYLGSGIYFTIQGIHNAFYQVSPVIAIIPSIILSFFLYKGKKEEKLNTFIDGLRNRDIIIMCSIFLLSGAFSMITKNMGSADSAANFVMSILPDSYLLIGLFAITAFISTAVGTSMGAIATIAPVAYSLADHAALSTPITAGIIISGAIFGDNLSMISDTTIAANYSQQSNPYKKLKLNGKIAIISSIIMVIILFFISKPVESQQIAQNNYSFILIAPYLFLITLSIVGLNVFTVLISSIIFSGIIGLTSANGYGLMNFFQDITNGFASMHEIMVLSLLVGGLSSLNAQNARTLIDHLSTWISTKSDKRRIGQLVIAKIVSIFDILFANNTIAIIFVGDYAKKISDICKIPPHYTATWLDIFSCIFQGILPYGAQVLLAGVIFKISPLSISLNVYYCYILLVVSILYILFNKITDSEMVE